MDTIFKYPLTCESLHNWHVYDKLGLALELPDHVRAALRLQQAEHHRGLSAREACEKICARFPVYLEFKGF
jgi:hypothetical protein